MCKKIKYSPLFSRKPNIKKELEETFSIHSGIFLANRKT